MKGWMTGAAACFAGVIAGAAWAEAGGWTSVEALERPRAGLAATVSGGVLYAAGGSGLLAPSSDFDAFDAALGEWRELPTMPEPRARFAMAALEGKIYVVGGRDAADEPLATGAVYAPAMETWQAIADMPEARSGHVLAALHGKLYALGGDAAVVDVFDPATNSWTRKPAPEATARKGAGAAVLDGRIFLVGGRADGAASAEVDAYDPVLDLWTREADLASPRAGLAAAAVAGRIHVVGGSDAKGSGVLDEHVSLAPGEAAWRTESELPIPRADLAAAALDGRLAVLGGGAGGGFLGPFTAVDSVDLFTPGS